MGHSLTIGCIIKITYSGIEKITYLHYRRLRFWIFQHVHTNECKFIGKGSLFNQYYLRIFLLILAQFWILCKKKPFAILCNSNNIEFLIWWQVGAEKTHIRKFFGKLKWSKACSTYHEHIEHYHRAWEREKSATTSFASTLLIPFRIHRIGYVNLLEDRK